MSKQDKINKGSDLIEDMLYKYTVDYGRTSSPRIDCLLWKGVLIDRTKYDAQLNIELVYKHATQVRVYQHVLGSPIDGEWIDKVEPFWEDVGR
jgi:hypothetical protein